MIQSRLKEVLDRKSAELVSFPEKEPEECSGASNNTYFSLSKDFSVRICHELHESKEEKIKIPLLPLAYTVPKNKEGVIAQAAYDVQQLLVRKQVCMDFIVNYFYVAKDGRKISPIATGSDLFFFIKSKEKKLSQEKVINLFAQILLVIADLHACGIAHRDIKEENFLVYEVNGDYFLRLTDLDFVAEVNSSDGRLASSAYKNAYTIACAGPELLSVLRNFELEEYKALDFFKLDMFAVGRLFNQVRFTCVDDNPVLFKELISALLQKSPQARPNISAALENKLFGNTAEERAAYFNAVREKNRELKFEIDGEMVTPLAPGNPYWVLPTAIKPIIRPISLVAEQIEENLTHLKSAVDSVAHEAAVQAANLVSQDAEKVDALLVNSSLSFSKELSRAFQEDLDEMKGLLSTRGLFKREKEHPEIIKVAHVLKVTP